MKIVVMKFCKFIKKNFLLIATIILIVLLFSMFKISENCMFICNRDALTKTMRYDFTNSEILDIKFKKLENSSESMTQMCVILKDENFLNDNFISHEMKELTIPTDDYSPDNLLIEKNNVLNKLKNAFPEIDLESKDINAFGYALTDDIQFTHFGFSETAYEGVSINWFVTEDKIYLTKKLHCKKVFCFVT